MQTVKDFAIILFCLVIMAVSVIWIGDQFRLLDNVRAGISKNLAGMPRSNLP